MVGIVIVSHSAALAEGVVALAREMGGEELALEAAGGLDDGSIGTDAQRVLEAIERAMSADGVLVLMDLGSALMSAEMALELLGDGAPGSIVLSEAPLVEGAVAAAAAARGGGSLAQVGAEAAGALRMKLAQLGPDAPGSAGGAGHGAVAGGAGGAGSGGAGGGAGAGGPDDGAQIRVPVLNEIGLHARPAALVVQLAGRFDAQLRLAKAGGAGPVSARSMTGLMTLVARKGDELIATASGPEAAAALAALEELARGGFGEGVAATAAAAPASHPTAVVASAGAATAAAAPASHPTAVVASPRSTTAAAGSVATAAAAPQPGAVLRGIPASTGIAIGSVRRLDEPFEPPPVRPSAGAEAERRRLQAAREAARRAIEHDRDAVLRRASAGDAAIFTAHLALLDDDELLAGAQSRIDVGASAETAWYGAGEQTADAWRALDDRLLSERAIDVEDVGRRVLAALAGRELHSTRVEGVLVVDELTPAQAAALDPALVSGIATARGTATAHAAILARALGIPAAVGLGPSLLVIADGTPVLLDGDQGTILIAPGDDALQRARAARHSADARRQQARRHALEPALTRDGTRIEVAANLGGAGGAADAVALGADAVGLLRTEFLFLHRPEIPSEDEQAQTLEQIAAGLDGRPLIVRTLDAGADKPLPALPMAPEANPFLGRRGLRLSLAHPELLATQLRAVLRVAARWPLKLMFPMVSTPAELDAALAALAQARAATGVDARLEVGIMVEVPAAALQARELARSADFFSIGTNDLTQYTMAAERGNEQVGELLAGPQPAVLRLIDATVAGAAAHGRWVGVCGELAGDPAAALLLVGLGARELSMAPPLVAEVMAALRSV
ncbi:MAG: phosphoenolpyruvate--protein phosphotransferase [Solirubrobacteraceae bacterium]